MFEYNNVYINDYYAVVGPKEKEANIKEPNISMDDFYYGEDTFEKTEIKMQKTVTKHLLIKNIPELIIASDLSNQLGVSSMSLTNINIPVIGLYSACASSASGIMTLSNLIENKQIKEGMFITSSHNLTAEKQFRYPIEYGAPKPERSTFTATAALGIILSNKKSHLKVKNATPGKIVDSYIKDAYNMGAVMAPSAIDTLINHLNKTKTNIKDYDLVLTGDLGKVGKEIFKRLMKENNLTPKKYEDAGSILYTTNKYSGASGPVALPLVFLYNTINNKKYKKILLLATGSLHNPTIVNQKNTISSITHALTIEVI